MFTLFGRASTKNPVVATAEQIEAEVNADLAEVEAISRARFIKNWRHPDCPTTSTMTF